MAVVEEENRMLNQGDGDYLPLGPALFELWGKDHWSTLSYVETRAVDYGGRLHNPHLRCIPDIHPAFAHGAGINAETPSMGSYADSRDCPTRLKGNRRLWMHDDWSCIEDLVAHGLVEVVNVEKRDVMHPDGYGEAELVLTDRGKELVRQVREFKADGGNFAEFEASGPVPEVDLELHEEAAAVLRSEEPFREFQ